MACSTSSTQHVHAHFLMFSFLWKFKDNEDEALEAARGFKTCTSTKDLSDLPPQNSFIAMSSLAPSWMLAEDR